MLGDLYLLHLLFLILIHYFYLLTLLIPINIIKAQNINYKNCHKHLFK